VAGFIGWLTIRHYREAGTALRDARTSPVGTLGVENLQRQTTPYDGQELDS
jgi:hypothetical protein